MKILFGSLIAIGVAFPVFIVAQALMQTAPADQSHSMQQDSQPASLAKSVNQGEKKIAGCLRQESGKFALDNADIGRSGCQVRRTSQLTLATA